MSFYTTFRLRSRFVLCFSFFIFSFLFFSGSLSVAFAYSPSLAEQAHDYFEREGIIQSDSDKKPDDFITKVEFLKIVLENVGFSAPVKNILIPTPYKDVPARSWYASYVQKAYRLGLIEKSENFNPSGKIRTLDALRLLLNLEGYTVPRMHENMPFKDLRNKEERRVAAKILELGLYEPRSEKIFGAQRNMNREESMVLIYRFFLLTEADKAIFSGKMTNISIHQSSLKNVEYLESAKEQLFSKFYKSDDLDEEKMMYEAISGFVKAADDKYTVYFPPQESKDFAEHLDGSFEGIGAYLEETDEGVLIQTPIKGSPAEKAGVKSGDIIKKVEGESVVGLTISDVVKLIKGPRGTKVNIEFERNGKAVTIEIIRDRIELKSVTAEVKNQVLVITINQFGAQTAIEFSDIITEMYKPSIKGIILDVRSNPGGFLSVAEEILSYWVEENSPVVQLQFKTHTQLKRAMKNQILEGVKTVVLQNDSSASASEILAGTLQDYEFAEIFGEQSFGKGSVQEIIQYNNGSSLKVTVAEWMTGKGTSINHIGVAADVEVEDNKNTEKDEVLEAAMNWVR